MTFAMAKLEHFFTIWKFFYFSAKWLMQIIKKKVSHKNGKYFRDTVLISEVFPFSSFLETPKLCYLLKKSNCFLDKVLCFKGPLGTGAALKQWYQFLLVK